MKCDDASMATMKTDVMAADAMKAGKTDDGTMHMKEAGKAMGTM